MSFILRQPPQRLDLRVVAGAIALSVGLAVLLGAVRLQTLPFHQPWFPVVGAVTFDGVPAAGARLAFFRDGEKRPLTLATATVQADGRYRVRALGVTEGTSAGRYVVTIVWQPPTIRGEDFTAGENALPEEYSDPLRTPLAIEVRPELNDFGTLAFRSVEPKVICQPNTRWLQAALPPRPST